MVPPVYIINMEVFLAARVVMQFLIRPASYQIPNKLRALVVVISAMRVSGKR
jgi:hypothetical protein